jgi:hypothetical protein
MTRTNIDEILRRLDEHSAALRELRGEQDRLMGGLKVLGVLLMGVLLPIVVAWASSLFK